MRPVSSPLLFPRPRARASLLAALVAGLLTTVACEQPAAEWADAEPVATGKPSPLAHPPFVPYDSTLRDDTPDAAFLLMQDQLRDAGAVTLLAGPLDSMTASRETLTAGDMPMGAMSVGPMSMAPAPLTPLGDADVPADSARCARSLRLALAPGRGRVAVWWTRAGSGRVHLAAAWRDTVAAEGRLGAWRGPIMVDTLDQGPGDAQAADRGAHGCARPAPALTVDTLNGFVHVAYALVGPEGPGVFYAHQMDPRSAFEPPVAVLYGEQLGVARVASHGELVAVVYEDPNGRTRRAIGVAISRTAGHLFEQRLTASGGSAPARDPYVAVRGRAVVVGWSDVPGDGAPVFTIRRATVR